MVFCFGKGFGKGLGKGWGWGKGIGKGAVLAAEAAFAGAVVASTVARHRSPPRAEVVVGADDVAVVNCPPPPRPNQAAAIAGGAVLGAVVAGPIGAVTGGALGAVASAPPHFRKGKGKGKGKGKRLVLVDVQDVVVVNARPVSPRPQEPSAHPAESDLACSSALESTTDFPLTGQVLEVQVPGGVYAGNTFPVLVPNGQQLLVELPDGYSPGASLQLWYESETNTLLPLL
jgi:hypothetical protein